MRLVRAETSRLTRTKSTDMTGKSSFDLLIFDLLSLSLVSLRRFPPARNHKSIGENLNDVGTARQEVRGPEIPRDLSLSTQHGRVTRDLRAPAREVDATSSGREREGQAEGLLSLKRVVLSFSL